MIQGRLALRIRLMRNLALPLLAAAIAETGCSGKSSPTAPPPSGPATLVVRSTPGAVPISIDGATATNWTPSTLSLTAGNHTIGLKFLGYRDTTISVSLSAAVKETLTVLLGPGPGTPRSFSTWQALSGFPTDIAVGPDGPAYVPMDGGGGSVAVFSLDGTKVGEGPVASSTTSHWAVAASGDAYFAQRVAGTQFVLNRMTPTATFANVLLYGGGNWPGPPCVAMGTGDTLLVLLNAPQAGVIGSVYRYVNNQLVDLWLTGFEVGDIAVDRTGRRCYFTGPSDSVYAVSTGGQLLTSWKAGLHNSLPGIIAVGPDGSVYLADRFTIRRFTGDGVPLAAWGLGAIGVPWGLAVDSQGRVYVADNATKQIVRYVP